MKHSRIIRAIPIQQKLKRELKACARNDAAYDLVDD